MALPAWGRACRRAGPVALVLGALSACGSPIKSNFDFGGDGGDGSIRDAFLPKLGEAGILSGDGTTGRSPGACPLGATTGTVTGKVYDPAGKNALYNVEVYVPAVPLEPLPRGVPTGANACSCSALFPTAAYASTATAVDGSFTLTNVPLGTQKIVAQIGKWRRQISVDVTCGGTTIPDRLLKLPGTVLPGDTDDNMPDIAVSTGFADSLECLMLRVGVAASEYVAGSDPSGHLHVFSGGDPTVDLVTFMGGGIGAREWSPVPNAPASSTALWASASQLMPYDVLLLSCEGAETYHANPQALEAYLDVGGRAFASHWHYAWFAGPLESGQAYTAPADWGANLADWSPNPNTPMLIGGVIDTTLNGSGLPFTKGSTMKSWLEGRGALGRNAPPGELSLWQAKHDALVTPANKASQPWILADPSSGQGGATMYFSFDTPISGEPVLPAVDAGGGDAGSTDAGSGDAGGLRDSGGSLPHDSGKILNGGPRYCGRAVFSDLHVGGDPALYDRVILPPAQGGLPAPQGCDVADLSPQEKALEFMLFDLSSCVTDDKLPIPDAGSVTIPPPPK